MGILWNFMGILRVHYGSGNYGYITGEIMGFFPLWLWVNYDELWVQEKKHMFFLQIMGIFHVDYGCVTIDYDQLRITGELWVKSVQNGVRADFSELGFNKGQHVHFRDQTTTVSNLRVPQKS